MNPRLHILWFHPTEGDTGGFASESVGEAFATIRNVVASLNKSSQLQGHCEFEEVASEHALIEAIDRLTLDDPIQARDTLFWILMPARDNGGRNYLGAAGNSTSLLIARLVTRFPLSWLVFNFRSFGEKDRAESMVAPPFESAANGGCPTRDRRRLAIDWHFFFGQPSEPDVKNIVELYLCGLRQWFDPIGFRGAMLGLLKPTAPEQPAPGDKPRPRTARESRRVFLALAIDDEPVFAMCMAYAAYRAGMGAIAVSSARLFGSGGASPIASIVSACASSPDHAPPDSVLILRDLDLQFADLGPGCPGASSLKDWPEPLKAVIESDLGVVVRIVSAVAREVRENPPENWRGVERRLGWREPSEYAGLSKPLASVLLAPETGLRTIPCWRDLVSVTRGRVEVPAESNSHHAPPRCLRDNIQFLGELASRLGESERVEDLASAALLELVRLEATRGAGPMLVAEAVSQLYLLEALLEIHSPYFYAEPELTARLRELDECLESVGQTSQPGLKTHLIRQILGKMKILYQSHGVFGAADELQRELLKRPRWVGSAKRRAAMLLSPLPLALVQAARGGMAVSQRLWGAVLWVFFHPLACLLAWWSFNLTAYGVARLIFAHPEMKQFAYLVITGNLVGGVHESWKTDLVVFINVIFLAIFTTSLFRWVTRD